MKVRLSIGQKIGFGFGVLILSTLLVFFLTYETLSEGREINDRINEVYKPSVSALEKLKSSILRSKTLVSMWALVQSREDTKEKQSLVRLIRYELPAIQEDIDSLSVNWTEPERRQKEKIYKKIEDLIVMYIEVQNTLTDMQSYDDPLSRFAMSELVEEDIDQQTQEIINDLNTLIGEQSSNITKESVTMIGSFDRLELYIRYMGFGLFGAGLLIAILTIRSIVIPVSRLKEILQILGKGKFPDKAVVDTGDEIGEMSLALQQLVDALRQTTAFSNKVGEGDFNAEYTPLSDEDVLGRALVVMRDKLKANEEKIRANEQELERKVADRTRQLEEVLENIRASIRYARRLQENILPSDKFIKELLPQSFIYFKPKDLVSGDFYFIREVGNKIVFAAVDCTGHGVPGAFMSLVGHNALNRALQRNPDLDPATILGDLSRLSARALNVSQDSDYAGRDGMDLALCVYDKETGVLGYAGAFNPLYLVRQGKLLVRKADKIVIGSPDHLEDQFSTHEITLEKGDMIYLFSDGYVDQFGGEKGRKFMYQPFRELLISISHLPMEEQRQVLAETMDTWRKKGKEVQEQIDDILVMGVRHQ